jgi:hypothetical protein
VHLAGVVAVPRTGVRRRHLRLALFSALHNNPRNGLRLALTLLRRHLRLALFSALRLALFSALRLALTLLHLLLGAVAVVVTRASLGLILLLRPRPVLLGPRL